MKYFDYLMEVNIDTWPIIFDILIIGIEIIFYYSFILWLKPWLSLEIK